MTEPPAEDPPPENPPAEPGSEPPASRQEGPRGTAGSSLDASRILVRALAGLPAEDREGCSTWLLGTSLGCSPG